MLSDWVCVLADNLLAGLPFQSNRAYQIWLSMMLISIKVMCWSRVEGEQSTPLAHTFLVSLIISLSFLFTYKCLISQYKPPCSVSLCTFHFLISFSCLSSPALPATKRRIYLQNRIKPHPTDSVSLHFPLWQETYIYNGRWNKLNTITFCVSPWYCDTDNRVSCFLLVHHIQ